jgi:S-sulfo-L-cysteine synthase (O-acetyl-L-serine-dependent)
MDTQIPQPVTERQLGSVAPLARSGEVSGNTSTDDTARRHITSLIGNTPLIELPSLNEQVSPVRILAKAEWFNPGGSVKDRPALSMILDGERSGRLTRDKTLIDATSGNTGIAYAMICAALGYKALLCVPKNIGEPRTRILESFGAELLFTSAQLGMDGSIDECRRLVAEQPDRFFYPDQYGNPANWLAHYNGTSQEILSQTNGEITHFLAGLGTTGTFTGNGTRFREVNPNIKLMAVQPDSPLHGLEGLKHLETSMVPEIFKSDLVDEIVPVATEDAQAMCRHLARKDGVFVGPSSGAAAVAALRVAEQLDSGTVVAVFPDSAHKYLDMKFWGVAE